MSRPTTGEPRSQSLSWAKLVINIGITWNAHHILYCDKKGTHSTLSLRNHLQGMTEMGHNIYSCLHLRLNTNYCLIGANGQSMACTHTPLHSMFGRFLRALPSPETHFQSRPNDLTLAPIPIPIWSETQSHNFWHNISIVASDRPKTGDLRLLWLWDWYCLTPRRPKTMRGHIGREALSPFLRQLSVNICHINHCQFWSDRSDRSMHSWNRIQLLDRKLKVCVSESDGLTSEFRSIA